MTRYLICFGLLLVTGLLTGFIETRYDRLTVDSPEDFDSLYPERRFSFTDRMEIRYVRAGEGHPVIFLHGLAGDHHQWNLNLPDFEPAFEVYALDFPGHGKTGTAPNHPYSIANHARAVLRLMEVENLEEAVLVGNSMGGHVALHLAVHHPERVTRLVLASPSGGVPFGWFDHHSSRLIARYLPLRYVGERILRWRMRALVERNRNHEILEKYLQKMLLRIRDPARRQPFQTMLREVVRSILESNLHRRVAEIDHPTLIVWGEGDRILDLEYGLQLHNRIRNSTLRIFPDTGHVPPFERPDWFHDQVEFFLRDLAREPDPAP